MQHLDEGTVHAWLDGALPPDEAARVEAHAAGCASCATLVAEARGLIAASSRILAALDGVPGGVLPVPAERPTAAEALAAVPDDAPAITEGVVPIADARRRAPGRWGRLRTLRAAAALLIVAGGTAVVVQSVGTDAGAPSAALESSEERLPSDTGVPPSAVDELPASVGASAEAANVATGATAGAGATTDAARSVERAPSGVASAAPAPARARAAAPRGIAGTARPTAPAPLPPPAPRVTNEADFAGAGTAGSVAGGAAPPAAMRSAAPPAAPVMAPPTPVGADAQAKARVAERREAEAALSAARQEEREDRLARMPSVAAAAAVGAPAVRQVSGWTVVETEVRVDSTALVRRTVYEVRPGVRVTLEEAMDATVAQRRAFAGGAMAARTGTARDAAAPQSETAAAPARVPPERANVLRWRSPDGTTLTLSGTVEILELQTLRERLP